MFTDLEKSFQMKGIVVVQSASVIPAQFFIVQKTEFESEKDLVLRPDTSTQTVWYISHAKPFDLYQMSFNPQPF